MQLSKKMLDLVKTGTVETPDGSYFGLPEKVMQFGTGVLLRGLTDYFIDKANKQAVFNGRIVMIKSTGTGDPEAFAAQDYLYTHCIRGIDAGKTTERNIINASVSRVLSAKQQWKEILEFATSPELSLVISNTTEVGIAMSDDRVQDSPPSSFPGKLLAVLYHRFHHFKGDPAKGLVIIPTELIPGNGRLLLNVLVTLSARQQLEHDFIAWLKNCNECCDSLVDRIVPGKLPARLQEQTESALGYHDDCMIMSESYALWAIESSSPKVKQVLSFSSVDNAVVIAPDIRIFRELKLRLLNGPHTLCCGPAVLAGFTTVKEAMADHAFISFMTRVMMEEIIPVITDETLDRETAKDFANKVLDRFRNPYMEHQWLSITLQYASKMKARNVPLILEYFKRFGKTPECMAIGFAAHLLFMKTEKGQDGNYYGNTGGKKYQVNDDRAGHYAELWSRLNKDELVKQVLSDVEWWGTDLSALPGFVSQVTQALYELTNKGVREVISQQEAHGITG
ncbi:MAG TPA: tagaturonate reductase [Puia sp.]|nr:tagaturonate reductase [Puia sp.]